jgi:hypothetical protein
MDNIAHAHSIKQKCMKLEHAIEPGQCSPSCSSRRDEQNEPNTHMLMFLFTDVVYVCSSISSYYQQ